jgi:hypothetical protein
LLCWFNIILKNKTSELSVANKKTDNKLILLSDVTMLLLLLLNINLLVLQWSFEHFAFRDFILQIFPTFHNWYMQRVFPNFFWIDISFVLVFMADFVLRWVVSVKDKEYDKWFFFPFVNWYDILGLIPVGSMRFFRLLRVFSFTIRLQKMGWIDAREWALYKSATRYRDIAVEEVSDSVISNMLERMKDEVKKGSPITNEVVERALKPNNKLLVRWVASTVQQTIHLHYTERVPELRQYLNTKVATAIRNNKELALVDAIPLLGGTITKTLENAVADITFQVVHGIVEDFAHNKNPELIDLAADISEETVTRIANDGQLNKIAVKIVNDTINIILEEVNVQEWKLKEQASQGTGS